MLIWKVCPQWFGVGAIDFSWEIGADAAPCSRCHRMVRGLNSVLFQLCVAGWMAEVLLPCHVPLASACRSSFCFTLALFSPQILYSILTHTHDSSGLENIGICCSKITRPKVCLRVSVIRIFNFKLLMLRLSSWWFDDICRTNFARFRHQTLGRLIRYHYIKFILRISDGKGGRGFHSKGLSCQYAAS